MDVLGVYRGDWVDAENERVREREREERPTQLYKVQQAVMNSTTLRGLKRHTHRTASQACNISHAHLFAHRAANPSSDLARDREALCA